MAIRLLHICLGLILSVLVINAPSHAQTSISSEFANQFYQNCLSQKDQRLTDLSQKSLCACTAAEMQQRMTLEQVQTMGQDTQAARDALNFMLLNVYAPCMTYPVQDLVKLSCMKDPKMGTMNFAGGQESLCNCISEKTGEWYATDGKIIMQTVLQQNPNTFDLITPVTDSEAFKKASYDNLVACVQN